MLNLNQAVPVRINGSRAKQAARPEFNEIDRVLRGIALSDSPVLIRAKQVEDGESLAKRIHVLSRRTGFQLSIARTAEEALGLVEQWMQGTWILEGVSEWDVETQNELAALIATLDETRLACRLSTAQLPRIVVIERADATKPLAPALEQRLAFFSITAGA